MNAAPAIAAFHERVAAEPAAAREQAEWLREALGRAGVRFDGVPMRSFLRPHLVDRQRWEDVRGCGRRLLLLLERVARRAFDGDAARLADWLLMPASEAAWIVPDPGQPDVVWSRLDAFAGDSGPRFIEVNSDAPAGFGYADRMAGIFRELPLFKDCASRFPISYPASGPALVDAILAAARPGASRPPRVAIVDFAFVKTLADQELLREAFAARGIPCVLADPRACELRGGRLYADGFLTDVVYRRAVLSELVACAGEVRGFLDAYTARAAAFVNSFRCRLSEDKALFALVSDEAFAPLLLPEERALVRRVVPWTRKLEERRTEHAGAPVDLVPFVLKERARLVLKPTHAYGGREVLLGGETAPAEWETAVRRGLGGAWVVQERQAIPEETFPSFEAGPGPDFVRLKLNLSPFYVRGAEVGAVARASQASVINVSAGGGSVPTFVVG